MLSEEIEDKLQYFDRSKVEVCNSEVTLQEKSKNGEVYLKCSLAKDTLIFHKPEDNTLSYLDGDIKYAKSGPDEFLFELDDDGKWILHIMEFKKSINTSSIKKSKIQFTMGIYNARALAGFFNIEIKKIYVYSAYRKDTILDMSEETLIQMRTANSDSNNLKIINEWKKGKCTLLVDLKKMELKHIKIKLDDEGKGCCSLVAS